MSAINKFVLRLVLFFFVFILPFLFITDRVVLRLQQGLFEGSDNTMIVFIIFVLVAVTGFTIISIKYISDRKKEKATASAQNSAQGVTGAMKDGARLLLVLIMGASLIIATSPTYVLADGPVVQLDKSDDGRVISHAPAQPNCSWQFVVAVAVIGGILFVGWKVYKACIRAGEHIQKKIEDADEDDDGSSTNQQQNVAFRLEPELVYCASFFVPAPLDPEDVSDCACQPIMTMAYVASVSNSQPIYSYVPTRTVSVGEYLTKHGLSTNLGENSFSYNGVPTNQLSEITMDANGVVRINIPGFTNHVAYSLESSVGDGQWKSVGSNSLVVPVGAVMKVGVNPTSSNMFFRITSSAPPQ